LLTAIVTWLVVGRAARQAGGTADEEGTMQSELNKMIEGLAL
jgi:hypothetical protein